MFSLERLLISFSALIGDSVSKTPKRHVLLCLLTFGLLAIGILLVEIEHDVFKLWVRIFIIFFFSFGRDIFFFSLFLGENLVWVFCSRSRRWLARIEGKKKKKDEPMRSRERKESVGFFASLLSSSSSSSKFSFFC